MPFQLHPAIGASLATLMGPSPPPPPPLHDVTSRRQRMDFIFSTLYGSQPDYPDVETHEYSTTTTDGHSLRLRWYAKTGVQQTGSAIIYLHGGGYISLGLQHYEKVLKRYVHATDVPFLAIDYRLAPEVQAPIPVHDAYAGLRWLHEHAAELHIDPNRIAVMGDSAGGGIAAALTHYIKLKGGPSVSKQILIYPMLDDRNTSSDPNIPIATWTAEDNLTGWTALLGDRVGKDDVHVIEAPGRMTPAEAGGLPPAYIDVGELDIFRDEDVEYARNLGKAGISCELHVVPSVPHAFEAFAPESDFATFIFERRTEFIRSV